MKGLLLIAGVIAAVSLTVGLNGALASSHSTSTHTKVGLAGSGLGRILVDGRGHTLYLFANDKHGKSTCSGRCAAFWPPLIASGRPVATAGAKASLLGTTKRADGRLQVTYGRHPLYTFVKDVRSGQTNGEEINAFGAEWYALSSTGTKVERTGGKTSSTGAPAAGGYGSGYGYGY
jgi:predicted lipoprotein with Yx(FWY)xxD motif